MLVDSHCHLDFNDFEDDFEDMLQRAKEQGVTAMLNAGNNVGELDKQLEISEKYPFIYTAAGVHPHNAAEYPDIKAEDFVRYSKHKKVVAIGECGLDYYYDYSPKDMQIRVLKEQVKAAQETGLPLIIHNRESDEDMMSVLDEAYRREYEEYMRQERRVDVFGFAHETHFIGIPPEDYDRLYAGLIKSEGQR